VDLGDAGTVAALVAAVTGAGLAIERYYSRRALMNGNAPATRDDVQGVSRKLDSHIVSVNQKFEVVHKEMNNAHTGLQDRVTDVATTVAELKGKLSTKV
jgi:flagellar hook-basal body complex protein FliE